MHIFVETRNGKNGGSKLPWSVRYKLALGIAEAVRYLHNGTERCVVHRDIKPSNILLSSRKSPKVKKKLLYHMSAFIQTRRLD